MSYLINYDEDNDESNRRHAHFIKELETALGILLQPLFNTPPRKRGQSQISSVKQREAISIKNQFSKLSVGGTADADADKDNVTMESQEKALPAVPPVELIKMKSKPKMNSSL